MKINKLNKYFLSSFIVGIFVIGLITINQASLIRPSNTEDLAAVDTAAYVPLTDGLPSEIRDSSGENITTLVGTFFQWGISIAVVLSIVMIMVGGLQYMTTDAYSGKAQGKERVTGAIIGLLLALSSFLILKEINPQIVQFDSNVFLNPMLLR